MDPAKIRVAVRVRPLLESEVKGGLTNTKIEAQEAQQEVRVVVDEQRQQVKSYK